LSLQASLVFEQSYGGVEGDSASLAETCALLSAIAGAPLRQSLGVTGSINQRGIVQVIGGVNEKVEGFFEACCLRGLTGSQGVIIPADNVPHLMLRDDVIAAVERGTFHLYAVRTLDDAIPLLTGLQAGERDASGAFPDGTFNALVERRLRDFMRGRQEFTHEALAAGTLQKK
jgi:predicted ATP-dependent protease